MGHASKKFSVSEFFGDFFVLWLKAIQFFSSLFFGMSAAFVGILYLLGYHQKISIRSAAEVVLLFECAICFFSLFIAWAAATRRQTRSLNSMALLLVGAMLIGSLYAGLVEIGAIATSGHASSSFLAAWIGIAIFFFLPILIVIYVFLTYFDEPWWL